MEGDRYSKNRNTNILFLTAVRVSEEETMVEVVALVKPTRTNLAQSSTIGRRQHAIPEQAENTAIDNETCGTTTTTKCVTTATAAT